MNQEGYTTSYQYDANGNLLETTNPDGTTQQYVYNALGEVTSSTDPDGQTITYAYNTNAQLTAENLPGGTSDTYTYDSHGNMLTADGPGGDWSFTYNSQNLPTTIAEPTARSRSSTASTATSPRSSIKRDSRSITTTTRWAGSAS